MEVRSNGAIYQVHSADNAAGEVQCKEQQKTAATVDNHAHNYAITSVDLDASTGGEEGEFGSEIGVSPDSSYIISFLYMPFYVSTPMRFHYGTFLSRLQVFRVPRAIF